MNPIPTLDPKAVLEASNRVRTPTGTLRNPIPEPTGTAAEILAAKRLQDYRDELARKERLEEKRRNGGKIVAPVIAQPKEDAAQFSGEVLAPPPGTGPAPIVAPVAPVAVPPANPERADQATIQERIRTLNEQGQGGDGKGPAVEEEDPDAGGSDLDEGEPAGAPPKAAKSAPAPKPAPKPKK